MNSWALLACYPRGSFYPLSSVPLTKHRRITKPCFRTCSACRPRSQARLRLYTSHPISIRVKRTFGPHRYSLGGDRPSQTTHQTLSFALNVRVEVSAKLQAGWCFIVARRLPPTLHNLQPNAGPSCSKAPRGLFVLVYLGRVFTAISISPGLSPRQFSSRSAFRAGRNLPDKEFRYLSTVIVTADVYRGFSFRQKADSLTLRHWSGVSPYTSPFGFAETCVFGKQSPEPFHCGLLA